MTLAHIKRLVDKGEGQQLEFKKKANFPEKIVKELVAFANSQGGRLILGVDDDGTVSGTRNIEGELFVVEKAIKELIYPQIAYDTELTPISPKKGVATIRVYEGKKKPYAIKNETDSKKGTAFIRYGEESVKVSKEMNEILRRRNKEKDQKFTFGDKEKTLMRLLNDQTELSLSTFASVAQISRFSASRTLIKLVLANVLDIRPTSNGDLYSLRPER